MTNKTVLILINKGYFNSTIFTKIANINNYNSFNFFIKFDKIYLKMLKIKSINLNILRRHFSINKIKLTPNLKTNYFSTNQSDLINQKEKLKMKKVSDSSDWSEKENFDSEWDDSRSNHQSRTSKEKIMNDNTKDIEGGNNLYINQTDPNDYSLNSILEEDELMNDIIYKQSSPSIERNFKSKLIIKNLSTHYINTYRLT